MSGSAKDVSRGFALGALGVVIFAMTLPMTRLAVGDVSDPQLPPAFVTSGRAALAGLLSIVYLRWLGAPRPARAHWPALVVCALGTVLGFPLFLALALRQVEAMHAAVITAVPSGSAPAPPSGLAR
jgi:drug/metabolite transporter (DMT)-like permease